MRQLLLDWGVAGPPTLDKFVIGRNQECIALIRLIANRAASTLAERFVYLWGHAASGKSHLLQALADSKDACYLPATTSARDFAYSPAVRLYLLDDCNLLPPASQIAAFALYNEVRESGGLLVAAGSLPPAQLALREDLRTRLAWGLAYELHSLSDEEKIAALTQAAQARGLVLSVGVLPYLLTHFRRDMQSLSAMIDALDRYSLETKRPITMPLLREHLQIGDHDNPT